MPPLNGISDIEGDWTRRITAYRGFFPEPKAATARDIRALWERRLREASSGHPIWMHVHVPYCPQICTFCHCGRLLLTKPGELDAWMERTRAETAFFAPVLAGTRVRRQYFGGGTPNILSPAQLDELLDLLESRFDHDPDARRTFEVLPSTHQATTLEVVARHGILRISAGVQSTAEHLLAPYARTPDIIPLARMMEDAARLGIDDVNIDLVWGLRGDSEDLFFRSLADVLALAPTSVSVHLLAPTPQNPVYKDEAEELDVYRRFRALSEGSHAVALHESFPNYTWRKLPTVMAVVRTDYVEAGRYHSWQYSDMETVGMDMFGLGRFSLSHLLGWARYENRSAVGRFDLDEPGYQLSQVDGAVDAAMDAFAELVRDRTCGIESIERYYGAEMTRPVRQLLDSLVSAGKMASEGNIYRSLMPPDSLFAGPVFELMEFASRRASSLAREVR